LDLGTGSGILAIAAAKLGYRPVHALDLDPQAVRVARTNAKRNSVSGTVRLICQDLTQLPVTSARKYSLICANLIYDVLLSEKGRILGRLNPKGTLVLAGVLRSQFAALRQAYEWEGMRLVARRVENEWASGAFVVG
jgi:ribosomal protein L11 methyltransferase